MFRVHAHGFVGHPFLTLFLVVLFVALCAGVVCALVLWVRHGTLNPTSSRPPVSPPANAPINVPESILRERFARGEIDEEEFRRRVEMLRATS